MSTIQPSGHGSAEPNIALPLSDESPSWPSRDFLRSESATSLLSPTGGENTTSSGLYLPHISTGSYPRSGSSDRNSNRERSPLARSGSIPPLAPRVQDDDCRQLILHSFAPRVAVFASPDTDEFVKLKGFQDGLYGLLRPYGESLPGKVVIRDSVGGSRGWDDFGIRFLHPKVLQNPTLKTGGKSLNGSIRGQPAEQGLGQRHGGDGSSAMDDFLDHVLDTETTDHIDDSRGYIETRSPARDPLAAPPSAHHMYLRKLLSDSGLVPYETFTHPVACLIAVSSRNAAPIEALRQLYGSTARENTRLPPWMGTEYLRYYLLIHDEDNDDITKSTALFDLMKRHFGLHCHLLRLRSSRYVPTDDDSAKVPSCQWLSAAEEMLDLSVSDSHENLGGFERYVFESDATAIRSFLREMATQSIVPFMENRVMTWNDQVASRRRGLSGRFMSLSKRWAGFGSTKGTNSGAGAGGNGSNSGSNYDSQQEFYPPETPEATMRQLADYAFMLRDWKLAYSTYDFVRTDFAHDKAWKYHAAANEMAALTSLINPQSFSMRNRSEGLNQMLEAATYSYLTRCSMPSGVIRCLTLAIELLRTRGSSAADEAARWGGKLLELGILKPNLQALVAERVAKCYMSRMNMTSQAGDRRRQSALWNVLASHRWMELGRLVQSRRCLQAARSFYELEQTQDAQLPFTSMHTLWDHLVSVLTAGGGDKTSTLIDLHFDDEGQAGSKMIGNTEQQSSFAHPPIIENTDADGFTSQDADFRVNNGDDFG